MLFCYSCIGGTDSMKHHNQVELFESIDPNVSSSLYAIGLWFSVEAVRDLFAWFVLCFLVYEFSCAGV